MRRERLSRLARRLRIELLHRPAFSDLPICPRCGMRTALKDWSRTETCCVGCEHDADPVMWDDPENDKPFLPEEDA